jgi:hypothetical protein
MWLTLPLMPGVREKSTKLEVTRHRRHLRRVVELHRVHRPRIGDSQRRFRLLTCHHSIPILCLRWPKITHPEFNRASKEHFRPHRPAATASAIGLNAVHDELNTHRDSPPCLDTRRQITRLVWIFERLAVAVSACTAIKVRAPLRDRPAWSGAN